MLERIAQRMEDKLDLLAAVEIWDNGKPIRETTAADLLIAIDHFPRPRRHVLPRRTPKASTSTSAPASSLRPGRI